MPPVCHILGQVPPQSPRNIFQVKPTTHIYKKNNTVEVLLHENLGGGFSPPAATKMRRNGRKARDHGIDRTPYRAGRKISFVSFHTRAISMGITKAEAATLVNAASKLKGILSGKRNGGPAAHS